jgi:dynein heavy chain
MTYMVYRYVNRGLYEVDKLTFVTLTLMKIMVQAGTLTASDINLYLRGGAGLDTASERKCTIGWMPPDVWLNVLQLSKDLQFFRTLPDNIARNEAIWKRWYEEAEAEVTPIPDLEPDLDQDEKLGPWLRLLTVRSLRPDRTILATKNFINKAEGKFIRCASLLCFIEFFKKTYKISSSSSFCFFYSYGPSIYRTCYRYS